MATKQEIRNRALAPTRRRFAAALELEGLTRAEWAAKQEVTDGHLYQVLTGRRESDSLLAKVRQFSDETIAKAQLAAA